ncbi:hypothetical protein COJ90_21105 [Priestia megaterium]|uniref:hypothetical protein n=1 Tax=Priestia megaterium TaxID=1404 RepID=UPI000BF3114F|nr:hypothetical protein [Priestia megaterium]PFP09214.1 hypothetical protein COJ90_21105 [Priestia megaterium]
MFSVPYEGFMKAVQQWDLPLIALYLASFIVIIFLLTKLIFVVLNVLINSFLHYRIKRKSEDEQLKFYLTHLKRFKWIKVDKNTQLSIMKFILNTSVREVNVEVYNRPGKEEYNVSLKGNEVDDLLNGSDINIQKENGEIVKVDNDLINIRTVSLVGTKIVFSLFSHSANLKKETNDLVLKLIIRKAPEDTMDMLINKVKVDVNV